MDVFAPDDLVREANDVEALLLVDVGGGTGTDALEFRRRYPSIPGRVILQELPGVIASAKKKNPSLLSKVR